MIHTLPKRKIKIEEADGNSESLKTSMLQTMVQICEEVKKLQTNDGEIISDGHFNIYGQCTGYYYAALYHYKHPQNPYYGDKALLDRCIKCWEFYSSLVNEEGKTHILTYGQSWGYVYEEWNTLHLMNSLVLLQSTLDQSTLEAFWDVAGRSAKGLAKHIRTQFQTQEFQADLEMHSVPNHFLWSLVCVYRYASLIGDQVLENECDRMMKEVCLYQLPFGAFLEGGSLVVLYSHTTLGALALYGYYCKDRSHPVHNAVLKNISYLNKCYYKENEIIGCFDSRNRDEKRGAFPHIPGAFLHDEAALEFASRQVHGFRKDPSELIRIQQSLGFFTASFFTMPDGLNACEKQSENNSEIIYIDWMKKTIPSYSDQSLNTLKIQKDGFVIPICILTNKVNNNRWYLQRQNLMSVYHLEKGLIIGGGHSQGTPELSCFNITSDGKMDYLHSSGQFVHDKKVSLSYNHIPCEIEIEKITHEDIVICYRAYHLKETDRVIVNIPIPVKFYERILDGETPLSITDMDFCSTFHTANNTIVTNKGTLSLSKNFTTKYPVFAYDTYMQKQAPNPVNAFLVLTAELDYLDNSVHLHIQL